MPYQPGVQFDASPIYKGMTSFGEGVGDAVQGYMKKRKESDSVNTSLEELKRNHPEALPDDVMEKYMGQSLEKRKALLGSATAELLNKYRDNGQAMEQQRIDQGWAGIAMRQDEQAQEQPYRQAQTRLANAHASAVENPPPKQTEWQPSAELLAQKEAEGYGWFPQGPKGGTWIKTTEDKKAYQPGSYILDQVGNKQGFVDDVGTPRMFETMTVHNDPNNVLNENIVDKRTGKPIGAGAQTPAAPPKQAPPGKVWVVRKSDGVGGWIPASSLNAALQNGYRQ